MWRSPKNRISETRETQNGSYLTAWFDDSESKEWKGASANVDRDLLRDISKRLPAIFREVLS
jgi:hypothetical protein